MLVYATRQPMVALHLDSVTMACPPTQPFVPPQPPPPHMKKVWLRQAILEWGGGGGGGGEAFN